MSSTEFEDQDKSLSSQPKNKTLSLPQINIPFKRQVIYLLILGQLPLLFVIIHFFSQNAALNSLSNSLELAQVQAQTSEAKHALNNAVRQHYSDADHFYIDKQLETLIFLEPEIESLQKVVNHRNFTEDAAIKKRLELLTNSNSLSFSEGAVQSTPGFQETIETLIHPVEVNINDLKHILAKVEGVEIEPYSQGQSRPQLIILDFKIDKKKISDSNEVLSLDMKLLKREFL